MKKKNRFRHWIIDNTEQWLGKIKKVIPTISCLLPWESPQATKLGRVIQTEPWSFTKLRTLKWDFRHCRENPYELWRERTAWRRKSWLMRAPLNTPFWTSVEYWPAHRYEYTCSRQEREYWEDTAKRRGWNIHQCSWGCKSVFLLARVGKNLK